MTLMAEKPKAISGFHYRWYLRSVLPDKYGKLCRVVTDYGNWMTRRMLVEFADGTRVECSRVAIRRLRRAPPLV